METAGGSKLIFQKILSLSCSGRAKLGRAKFRSLGMRMPQQSRMDGANITFGFLHISNVETRLKIGIKGSDIQREREIGNLNRRVSSYKVIRQCIPNMYAVKC